MSASAEGYSVPEARFERNEFEEYLAQRPDEVHAIFIEVLTEPFVGDMVGMTSVELELVNA